MGAPPGRTESALESVEEPFGRSLLGGPLHPGIHARAVIVLVKHRGSRRGRVLVGSAT